MTNRIVGRFLIASVLLGASSAVASAQVPTGTINGIVSDPHDAIVPNTSLPSARPRASPGRVPATRTVSMFLRIFLQGTTNS